MTERTNPMPTCADHAVACFRCCGDAFACLSIIIGAKQDDDKPSTTDALIVAGLHIADRSSPLANFWREEAAAGGLQPCGRHGNSSRPQPAPSAGTNVQSVEAAARAAAAAAQEQAKKASRDLANARAELDAARKDLAALRNQLEAALDALDRSFEPQRDRNCSPVRSRALMSHYQWLREQGHERRAATVVAKVVRAQKLLGTTFHA